RATEAGDVGGHCRPDADEMPPGWSGVWRGFASELYRIARPHRSRPGPGRGSRSYPFLAGAFAVSKSQPVSEAEARVPTPTQPVDPLRNPSYPQRVHVHERPHWQGVLRKCEERIAMARQKMNVLGASPNRAAFERLFAQMLGARDQVADAARRLPMETGDLYE